MIAFVVWPYFLAALIGFNIIFWSHVIDRGKHQRSWVETHPGVGVAIVGLCVVVAGMFG